MLDLKRGTGRRTEVVKVALLYICVTHGKLTPDFASRFAGTLMAFDAGHAFDLLVICNGGPLAPDLASLFLPLPNVSFFPRQNTPDWDIGGYIAAAHGPAKDYDAVLCCGESVTFTREGWLARFVKCWEMYGPGVYGPFSSNFVRAHLNTSCFFTSPKLLREYPRKVTDRASRYEFEHGENSFWRWVVKTAGGVAMLVTWSGAYLPQNWRSPPGILWRGMQENLVVRCNHADGYTASPPATQQFWSRAADSAFR